MLEIEGLRGLGAAWPDGAWWERRRILRVLSPTPASTACLAQDISVYPSLRAWRVCHLELHGSLHMRNNGGRSMGYVMLLSESLLGLQPLL